jgi:hypothetical protein
MEAAVILFVPLVAAAIYLGARFSAAGRPASPQEELQQLRERLAWHEDRLRRAREKNWDESMTGPIAEQLADTRRQLAQITTGTDRN